MVLAYAMRVGQLDAELTELRAAHSRAVADYQNLRRRSIEERSEQARLLTKTLIVNYLPILDDLNRALDSLDGYGELKEHQWVEGVRVVQRKFWSVLQATGVGEIEAAPGVPFDPELHEAVANQPGPLNEVIGVVQSGYTIDSTVIRPAMVIVGDGGSVTPASGDENKDEDNEQS
jgi:molecular chaperone GrpE